MCPRLLPGFLRPGRGQGAKAPPHGALQLADERVAADGLGRRILTPRRDDPLDAWGGVALAKSEALAESEALAKSEALAEPEACGEGG